MKNAILFLTALVTICNAASAAPGNNGGGNGGCGVGQQTNGCGTPPPPPSHPPSPPPGTTNHGGAGGSGTGVGVGIGVGIGQGGNATGGSVRDSGNSSSNSAVIGSGNSANRNINGAFATGGSGGAGGAGGLGGSGGAGGNGYGGSGGSGYGGAGGSSSANSGGNTLTGGAQTQANSVTVNGDTVMYEAQARNPVATAYAAPLAASNGTCMGSTSAGAQGVSFGISFGSTWTDPSCDMRYDAEALRAAGLPGAARARLCQKAEIAKAMEAAGTPCPGTQVATALPADAQPVATDTQAAQQYTDPIIRARLGLPPLR